MGFVDWRQLKQRSRMGLSGLACLVIGLVSSLPAQAQQAARLSTAYIPDDAMAVVYLHPGDVIDLPEMKLMPTEVADAWMQENLGVQLADIAVVKAIATAPGQQAPAMGLVIELTKDFDITKMNRDLLAGPPEMMDGYEVYPIAEMPPGTYLHQADARTVIVAQDSVIGAMIAAEDAQGPLATLASKLSKAGTVMGAMTMAPIREQIAMATEQMPPDLPPPLRALADIPELTEGVVLASPLTMQGKIRLVLLANDEQSAVELEEIINNAIAFGRDIAVMQAMGEVQGMGAVPDATRAYIQRLGNEIVAMVQPKRTGNRLMIEVDNQGGFATTGVLVGLLLPAVQASREAARRMSSSNNLKQIMLALHNYHDVYGHFPPAISRDDDGNPLLSWRVAILPFVEQAQLYNEFHLDEPWDSEHNIQLLDRMPSVFADPSAPPMPGMTTYYASVGENYCFSPDGPIRFRDITDGTSNTIAVFEGNPAVAVPWSQPSDAEIDPEDPLSVMGGVRAGGFNVAFTDGSVSFISEFIDLEMLLALLTRNGGEIVQRP
jgi:prepilin-type processing-associated H-X9-DG protein